MLVGTRWQIDCVIDAGFDAPTAGAALNNADDFPVYGRCDSNWEAKIMYYINKLIAHCAGASN